MRSLLNSLPPLGETPTESVVRLSREKREARRRGEVNSQVDIEDPMEDTSLVDHGLEDIYAGSQREFQGARGNPVEPVTHAAAGFYGEYSKKLSDAHKISLQCLIYTALDLAGMPCDSWVIKRKKSPSCQYKDFIGFLVLIMLGAENSVLEHFVKGDLCKAEKTNPELERRLKASMGSGNKDNRPTICAQYLANKNDVPPTSPMLFDALDQAEAYVSGNGGDNAAANQRALFIDRAIGKSWHGEKVSGKGRYILKDQAPTFLR